MATAVLDSAPTDHAVPADGAPADSRELLRHAIEHAAHYLPAQGPITVFIHHNTLHAFEDLPFDAGVQKGAALFGCQPYLSEDRYREHLSRGRIQIADLSGVLLDDLGDGAEQLLGFMGTRFHLRLAMLQYPVRIARAAELRWFVAETDALNRLREEVPFNLRQRFIGETRHWVLRDLRSRIERGVNGHDNSSNGTSPGMPDSLAALMQHFGQSSIELWTEETWEAFGLRALWRICCEGVQSIPPQDAATHRSAIRHRDWLFEATGDDADILVHDVLVKFCSAFLDQGFSRWPLPSRDQGFFRSFAALYQGMAGPPDRWMGGLANELARLEQSEVTPLESIRESLDLLGVPVSEWESYITATLLALRGWGGMVQQVELRADSVAHPIPKGSLIEFLAVRLILDRLAAAWVAQESLGYDGPLRELCPEHSRRGQEDKSAAIEQRAFQVFQLAQILGWLPQDLNQLRPREWSTLVAEVEAFPAVERRRVFHAAYERRYRVQILDAVAIQSQRPTDRVVNPRFQVVCCLDEREESFRRHLEEVAPDVETFGVAGFFGVPIYYRGAADAHYVPLCPIVIRPQQWVEEDVVYTLDILHSTRARARRALGTAAHQMHVGSRTFAGGAVLTAGLGALASIPLVARVLWPRFTSQIRKMFSTMVQPPPHTRLEMERSQPTPSPEPGHIGFTLDEMTNLSERMLRDIGMTRSFARLVVTLGHGSYSLNNPHNSAYNCGACGGGCGGPNGRAIAQMLNDLRVRERLKSRGIVIPDDTYFVGGWHNTCNDSITFFDLDRLPKSHRHDFDRVRQDLDETCDRNAHERCRRFVSAPLNMSFPAARRHVEARSEDLAQTRPECGHATNTICIVARRSRTRGLYLDRRAFLTSYDPTEDDANGFTLTRLLSAAVPVCGGINLEYYFSYVDNQGFGCGTKLPHNVTSLLGVMDGAASDLRTGLPWQMVEIHEPVRLLFIIETTPEILSGIMDRNPGIGKLCRNGWVQVATLSPRSSQMHLLRGDHFEPYHPESINLPTAASSVDWYRGWRDHLGCARIGAEAAGSRLSTESAHD